MDVQALKTEIDKALPGVTTRLVRESILIEKVDDLPKVVQFLKSHATHALDYLSSVTATDYLEFLECVYHLYSMSQKLGPVVLKVRVPRKNPEVPSLVSVFRGAEFQEREVYDMYGIRFTGHPDLRRIFMWEGFEGYPMRKDYQQEDSEVLETADVEWLERHKVKVSDEHRKQAEELKKQGTRVVAKKPGQTDI